MRASRDHALGSILGAFVGDAAGAPLEFRDRITADDACAALAMPGGGCWNVGPGQVTDDSELALALAQGLSGHDPKQGFPADDVAAKYCAWLASDPFDVGGTCATAFSIREQKRSLQANHPSLPGSAKTGLANRMRAQAEASKGSKANGALMRVAPLAVWAASQPTPMQVAAAASDASLSHPNQTCQDCNVLYCLAIAQLINHPGDADEALHLCESWAAAYACLEVQEWLLTDSKSSAADLDCTHQIGFVRWAFTLAFMHLRRRSSYEAAILETVLKGGDTDTNAAIVGGLMGAYHGASAIPAYMKDPVLTFAYNPAAAVPGQKRPHWLSPKQLPELVDALLAASKAAVPSCDVDA